jgi:prolyl-tRNA synthetase
METPVKKVETVVRKLDIEERSTLITVVSRVVASEKENFKSQLKLHRLYEVIDSEGVELQVEQRGEELRDKIAKWEMIGAPGPRPRMTEKEVRGDEKECHFPLTLNTWTVECLKKGSFSNYVQRDREAKIVDSVPMMPSIVSSLLAKFGITLDD